MVLQFENCVSMAAQQDFLANKDSPPTSMVAQQDVLANKDSPPASMLAQQDVLANKDSPPASMVAHQDVLANSEYILSTTTKNFAYVGGGPCTTSQGLFGCTFTVTSICNTFTLFRSFGSLLEILLHDC